MEGCQLPNGYFVAKAYMSYAQIPLEDVAVVVTSQDGTAIAMRLTGRSGLTERIPIPAPEKAESLEPEEHGQKPFTNITVCAYKNNFEQIFARNVQIFPDVTTVQNFEMVPLSELPDRWDENVLYNTPPQNL